MHRILIVDDESMLRETMAAILSRDDYTVDTAADEAEAADPPAGSRVPQPVTRHHRQAGPARRVAARPAHGDRTMRKVLYDRADLDRLVELSRIG